MTDYTAGFLIDLVGAIRFTGAIFVFPGINGSVGLIFGVALRYMNGHTVVDGTMVTEVVFPPK